MKSPSWSYKNPHCVIQFKIRRPFGLEHVFLFHGRLPFEFICPAIKRTWISTEGRTNPANFSFWVSINFSSLQNVGVFFFSCFIFLPFLVYFVMILMKNCWVVLSDSLNFWVFNFYQIGIKPINIFAEWFHG